MTSPLPSISGLADLAVRYDAVLSDVWGVVHNGVEAFPSAVQALAEFRKAGGKVVFITNAPRPSGPIIEMLDRLGVHREAYDAIVSSGDATRAMIAKYSGRAIHHVGPATEDDALYEGLGVRRAGADEAEVVVVTDLDTDDDTPEMYRERARHWLSRKLPMICANPDRVVEHGDKIIYCGGALGDLYAAMGGMVLMAGKPYQPIYEEAFRLAEVAAGRPLDKDRVLAIGDSVRTDATGAAQFGIDLLFVTGSIHAAELDAFGKPDPQAIADLVAPSRAHMAGFLPRLTW
ncbi:MAG: TIGR01459 family HAD-type hydrolase [Alphaproteobacteria bacterium]|jgi:HAD superfamily hydrolase (TIGR01459 family)|nr:TIGR01459 family HAD-type hydrolase [Alphaproteobacteria bacterium]MBU1562795.1 TIGR01459 family HAD-type hydrolase [Alphaproteobacteria bacterium]MBU2301412.1 TIGR01459 family HAD-type hydrolase [Alphaproteobacteria bacterium]MBU2368115.1 TIGR01459 family HAD-type hydrolase [Alphaproteobacteria bacterium]